MRFIFFTSKINAVNFNIKSRQNIGIFLLLIAISTITIKPLLIKPTTTKPITTTTFMT